MQMPKSANEVPKRSSVELRRAAERMPIGVATSREIAIARPASWRLGLSRRATFSITGSWLRMERPRSPRSRRPIHVAYWRWSGRSRPRVWRSSRLTLSSTDSAIMASIGSPGVRWMSAKTPAVTSSSTGIVATSRRRISRPTAAAAGLLQPDVLEAHHPVRDRVVALHPRAEGLGLDRVHDEDHRQLLLQDPHELAEELLALGLARGLARLVEEGVDLRIR